MTNPHQPSDPAKMTPEQERGEQFGKIKRPQVSDRDHPNRSDTPRASEPETRGTSGRRG